MLDASWQWSATGFPPPQHPQSAPSPYDIPLPVENLAAQAQPQDLQYVDMGNYGMAIDFPAPQGDRDHIIGDNTGTVQGVPAQAHRLLDASDQGC